MNEKKRAIEFGRRLRAVREKGSDSLRKVEARSGLNSGYLSQLENGKITHPSPSVLQKVAAGYGLRFGDLLKWTGYVEEAEQPVGTNQAVAFSSVAGLGEPSDEELEALRAIVDVLQKNRKAGFALPPGDEPLGPETSRLVRGYATSLLREADALGARPTPLEDVQAAARLVLTGELSLDINDKERLLERFGHWVNKAWRRLQGSFDFRTREIWVKPDLHPSRRRFVISHEIGHAIIPAHRRSFAYIDDKDRMPPFAREFFEREANQAAIEILMQGGQAAEEFESSAPSRAEIRRIADAFGASIVATARYIVENSRRPIALAVCHSNEGRLGPPHVYASQRFERVFGWRTGRAPWEQLRPALQTAASETEERWISPDLNSQGRILQVETMHTGYAALVLVAGESRLRSMGRLFRPAPAASAAG
jgi:HTH-type transcriptional regulator, competence development regulator